MTLTDDELAFLRTTRSAAMITHGADGSARAVRIGFALVDGRLWSSGTEERIRTRRLRRDPRCTLFVFEPGYFWLTLETRVEVLDGPEVPDQSIRLFREMQDNPDQPLMWFGRRLDDDVFRQTMIDEGRVIYEFHVERSYGMLAMP